MNSPHEMMRHPRSVTTLVVGADKSRGGLVPKTGVGGSLRMADNSQSHFGNSFSAHRGECQPQRCANPRSPSHSAGLKVALEKVPEVPRVYRASCVTSIFPNFNAGLAPSRRKYYTRREGQVQG